MAFSPKCTMVSQAIIGFLDVVGRARRRNTLSTYSNAMNFLWAVLDEHGLPPEETGVDQLTEDAIKWLLEACNGYPPATDGFSFGTISPMRPLKLCVIRS